MRITVEKLLLKAADIKWTKRFQNVSSFVKKSTIISTQLRNVPAM